MESSIDCEVYCKFCHWDLVKLAGYHAQFCGILAALVFGMLIAAIFSDKLRRGQSSLVLTTMVTTFFISLLATVIFAIITSITYNDELLKLAFLSASTLLFLSVVYVFASLVLALGIYSEALSRLVSLNFILILILGLGWIHMDFVDISGWNLDTLLFLITLLSCSIVILLCRQRRYTVDQLVHAASLIVSLFTVGIGLVLAAMMRPDPLIKPVPSIIGIITIYVVIGGVLAILMAAILPFSPSLLPRVFNKENND